MFQLLSVLIAVQVFHIFHFAKLAFKHQMLIETKPLLKLQAL